jgi:amidase
MAIGGDQGGSVRIPAGWTGIYGLKPTWGLVPYTGAMPIEPTIDHLGPMARSTADVALLLEVIAGPDGMDPRQGGPQSAPPPMPSYLDALTGDVRGLRVAVVREGFAIDGLSEPEVDAVVQDAVVELTKLGAVAEEVSIPWHTMAMPVWSAIATEGMVNTMLTGNGMGTGWRGRYTTSLLEHFARGRRERGGVGRLHLRVDLGAVHRHAARGVDAEADGLAAHVEHDDAHVVADDDALAGAAGEDQHGGSFSPDGPDRRVG